MWAFAEMNIMSRVVQKCWLRIRGVAPSIKSKPLFVLYDHSDLLFQFYLVNMIEIQGAPETPNVSSTRFLPFSILSNPFCLKAWFQGVRPIALTKRGL
jgi:hypothetical protein